MLPSHFRRRLYNISNTSIRRVLDVHDGLCLCKQNSRHCTRMQDRYVYNVTNVLFMYLCIHIYIYACSVACIHRCIRASIHPSIHPSIHRSIHPSIHPSINPSLPHTYMHTYVHAFMHTCILAYMHAFIRAYLHSCFCAAVLTKTHDDFDELGRATRASDPCPTASGSCNYTLDMTPCQSSR